MTEEEIRQQLEQGARFVVFEFTISILVLTIKNPSPIYFIRAGEGTFTRSIGYTAISLLFGWWGIPFGPIYTVMALVTNFSGGKEVTADVMGGLNAAYA